MISVLGYNVFVIEKIRAIIKDPRVQQMRDIRYLGFCVFGVMVLLVSWSGVGVIQANYKLQQQISALQQQNVVFELKNKNLKLGNEYYKTSEYLELQARKQFGKAAPGETVLLVSTKVALAHTVEPPKSNNMSTGPVVDKPTYQRNFEAWTDFLIHQKRQQ